MNIFDGWFELNHSTGHLHEFYFGMEDASNRGAAVPHLVQRMKEHYVAQERIAEWLEAFGKENTGALVREKLPTSLKAKSGDFGEILATEFLENQLGFIVPIRKLRWKDEANASLRGDDFIGLTLNGDGELETIVKGEAKSRQAFLTSVVEEAATALDKTDGFPNHHSVTYCSERLSELGNAALATAILKAKLNSYRNTTVRHALFYVTQGDGETEIRGHGTAYAETGRHFRSYIRLRIEGHKEFIESVFELLNVGS